MPLKIAGGPLILGRGGGLQIKSGAAFTPSSIAGLQAWFKADAITPVADGTALATWPDSSTNARNLAQATGANQPLYKTAIQNSKPVVRFDGVNDSMATAAFTAVTQPLTLFLVGQMTSASGFSSYCDGIGASNRAGIGDFNNTGKHGLYAGSGPIEALQARPTSFHVWSALANNTTSQLWKDGASFVTGTAGGQSLTGVTLGANFSPGNFLTGDIAEYLLYSGSLSTANRQAVEAYLKAKWGTP